MKRRQNTAVRPRKKGSGAGGQLRIISGTWRGRRLDVPDLDGLRPTGDRLRETLFNWLMADVANARCLDLFAGTGALGFEALSRGAAHCDFVELKSQAVSQLRAGAEKLGAGERARITNASWESFLTSASGPYDIVFLDPPFEQDLLDDAIGQLHATNSLRASALLYLEFPLERPPRPRQEFEAWKETRSGAVGARLWRLRENSQRGPSGAD